MATKPKSMDQHFQRAIKAAEDVKWVHRRIQTVAGSDVAMRQRFINSLFGAGRINGEARVLLMELYVDEV